MKMIPNPPTGEMARLNVPNGFYSLVSATVFPSGFVLPVPRQATTTSEVYRTEHSCANWSSSTPTGNGRHVQALALWPILFHHRSASLVHCGNVLLPLQECSPSPPPRNHHQPCLGLPYYCTDSRHARGQCYSMYRMCVCILDSVRLGE